MDNGNETSQRIHKANGNIVLRRSVHMLTEVVACTAADKRPHTTFAQRLNPTLLRRDASSGCRRDAFDSCYKR